MGKISRAAVADGRGGYSIQAIEVFPPETDEVLVEMHFAGLCHTDWDTLTSRDYPFVLGHEGAGIVREVGPQVTRVATGDRVVLNWAIPCGSCRSCLSGLQPLCEVSSPANGSPDIGHARPKATLHAGLPIRRSFFLGTMADLTVVRQGAVVKLDPGVPLASAALLSCGVMTGYGSVFNAAKVPPGATTVVLGCGGVGLNVIQACALAGAEKVISIDIAPERLRQAEKFGATHTIINDPADRNFEAIRLQVMALTRGGADFAFECTAIPALGPAPLAFIRHGGTAVQVSGIEETVAFDCRLFEWDKTYINPLYGQCVPDRDFPQLQKLYLSGQLKLDELISQVYELEQLPTAFEDLLGGRLMKGVLKLA